MAKSIKLRQGTETEHEAFTGQMAEVTFDTTNNRIVLHDGSTPGGIPMAKLSDVPVDLTDLTDVDGNLTSVAAVFSGTTYVVTVASGTNTYGTGNKYYIAVSPDATPTVTLTEGETYRFDQSDSTNTGHPLKFSTTANGTHDSGSEYTTGVTYNGVPGQANAYTEITVEVGAPTLYYYCQNHSGMGSVGAAPAAPAENSPVLNSSNTTLLVTATGTSDNNNITDSSTNNHSITVNGDVTAGTFSPYRSGGYSLEFNGSNSAVGIQSSDVQIGTGAFSMEFWLYSRAHSALISSKYSSSNSNGYFVITTSTSDGLTCRTRADDSNGTQKYVHSGSGTYNLNQWNHCIFQRDANGNLTSYLNGTKYTGDNDGSTNLSATELALGVFNYIGFETWFDGYIRDFKLTIGTSALRTDSNITVPTEPLTSDSNTTAFLGHSPYLVDGSTNSNSIVSTNVIPSTFSPYDYLGYAAADHGGSVYFDGTGDYITVDDGFHFGTDDFTFEFWLYPTANLGAQHFINAETSGSGVTWSFGCASYGGYNGLTFSYGNYGTYTVGRYVNNYWPTQNTWTHLAVQRRNGIIEIFVNGTSQTLSTYNENGTFSDGANLTSNYTSRYFFNDLEGYVSDLKVIKGQAIYTSNFTSPTAPLSSSDSSLHIKGTDASIIDKSQSSNNLTLFGNTTGSTTQAKFAETKSMYFDGSGDYIKTSASTDYDLPSDFTIEAWIYPTALSSHRLIVDTYSTSQAGSYQLYWRETGNSLAFYSKGDGVLLQDPSSSSILVNTWNHVAVSRSGTSAKLFVNGTVVDTATNSRDFTHGIPVAIGYQQATSNNYFAGYMQDVRITKGLARYTADFTPPTQSLGTSVEVPAEVPAAPVENSPVLNSSNTTLLVTATGTYDNNNIIDSSTNNHSITVNGDVTAGTFSPYRSGGYSTYFDGSGDKLTLSGSALSDFNFGTNSFSIEFWMYPTGAKGPIFNTHKVGTANGYYLSLTGTNQFIFGQYVSGGADYFSTVNAYELNEWNHVSLNRDANNGNSLKLYVNGSLVLTTTNSTNYNSYAYGPYIGGYEPGGTQYFFGGYISDLIVTNGSVLRTGGTSLSDVAFTPPTEAFESDANTALLISSSLPYIKDSSSNSHDITVTGDVSTMPFSSYDYTEYDPSIHGGSVYFDGSGGHLTLANDASLNPGSGDFTLESWVYLNTLGTAKSIISTFNGGSTGYWDYQVKANNTPELSRDNGAIIVAGSTVLTAGQWHHLVVTRSGTTIRHFTNGVIDGTNTDSVNITSGNSIAIGSTINNVNKLSGYISDYRIVKGTAVYTAAFTPPTAPLSSSGSSLHLKGTDASIIDKSQTTNVQLFGNTTGSTTQVKFADTKSMYFDATGYVRVEDLGSGPLVTNEGFTIETWVNPTVLYSGNRAIFGLNKISNGDNVIVFTGMEGGAIYYGSTSYWTTSTNVPENEWSHVAVVVVGTSLKTYLNGSEVMSQTYSGLSTINWDDLILAIGGEFDAGDGGGIGNRIEGYIQDFRITKGLARYTENFTPPTKSLGSYVVPAEVPEDTSGPMWSLSGDSATFEAVTTAKLDTNATDYVALHHPTGWGNSWGLEDGSYAMRNNPNVLNDPAPGKSVHIWSTDDLSEGMTYQYYIKFGTAQPTMWEDMTTITSGSSALYSYAQYLTSDSNYPHTLAWLSNGQFDYYTHSANGTTRLDTQGWLHFAIELQSNGRIVHYINGEVVVNEDASDISGLTNKANVHFASVNSWMTDIEVYTGGGIHNPDLLETPPGFTPPARKQA